MIDRFLRRSNLSLPLIILIAVQAILRQPAALAHAPSQPLVSSTLITHLDVHRKIVALTFDACETHRPAGYDAKLIAILRQTHTPATLMLCGSWMATHPAVAKNLAEDPLFEIGSHSYWHPHMTRLTASQMRAELQETQDEEWKLTGKQGVLFRPPYGEYNATLLRTAASLGLRTYTWTVVSGDPDPHVTAHDMIREILRRVRPGSIVVMHMNGRGVHTDEALPAVIAGLKAKGYSFVTVSEGL